MDTSGAPCPDRDRQEEGLMAGASSHAEAMVEAVFREEWRRIVASLIAMTGDWDLAEECAQDAFTRALQAWDRDGVPARPGAWLTTAARNRAVDVQQRPPGCAATPSR
jgi:RNA polymerase sigma-70 factor, ECF subfamily